MSIEHLGVRPLERDQSLDGELPQHARLYTLRSQDILDNDKDDLHEIGVTFLKQLGDTSFRMRFGAPKPDTRRLIRLVDHFLDGQAHPHAMLLLLHDQHLLGAASIFHHQLRASPSEDVVDTTHVAELSITIADQLQCKDLGKLLMAQARQFAVNTGCTHAYFGFEPTNEASRRMVEAVCGADQLVAGANNPRDKYYRIATFDPSLERLEQTMRRYCDDVSDVNNQPTEEAPKYARFSTAKLGRKVLEALESIEIKLPEGLRL